MRYPFFLLLVAWLQCAAADAKDTTAMVNVLDTAVLNDLQHKGFSFPEALGEPLQASNAQTLYQSSPRYRSMVDILGKSLPHDSRTDQLPAVIPPQSGDIPELVRLLRQFEDKGKRSDKDSKGGYFIRQLSNNSQYPYTIERDGDEPRHFDTRWLSSPWASMQLVALVNRLDRVDFNPESCGEVRLIYRLSYRTPKAGSSLPFFADVVYQYPKQPSCAGFAQRWMGLDHKMASWGAPNQIAEQLRNKVLKDLVFKQLEINFQSLRFTSGYMQDFGGQAMYMLRIFRPRGDALEVAPLENTPDVQAVERDPALLDRLVAYLKQGQHLQQLDQGTLNIDFDPKFLSTLAVSWSTLGRARTANKPYTQLFSQRQELLHSIDISQLQFIKSHEALVERLNNLSCMGCHQSGGTAGFHMLGRSDPQYAHRFTEQALALSPHAYAESFRRQAFTEAVAQQREPNHFRPHSNFPAGQWQNPMPVYEAQQKGELCVLEQRHFAKTPACAPGYSCTKTVDNAKLHVLFGECTAERMPQAGSACWQGEVIENSTRPTDRGPIPSSNFFAFQDRWKLRGALASNPQYRCVLPQSGAPLGRSSRACSVEEENFSHMPNLAEHIPDEMYANQGGNGFDLCAASGDAGACLESRVVRSMLDTCYPGKACREDYICQKVPDYSRISQHDYASTKNGKRVNLSSPDRIQSSFISQAHALQVGFCVPTYFLFNMRADGHPNPVTGLPPGPPTINRSLPNRGYPQ